MLKWPDKDPNEVLDYQIDWTERLSADTIASSTWIISDATLVQDSASNTTTTTTIWLSAGTLDSDYEVTNRIVTIGGRTMDQTVKLRIRAK